MLTIQVLWVVTLSAGDADPDVSKQCTTYCLHLKEFRNLCLLKPITGRNKYLIIFTALFKRDCKITKGFY
jgi:hypothetical protein